MKRALGVVALAGLTSCSFGGVDFTQPSKAFNLSGDYVLAIQAAAECDMPVTRFEWNVTGARSTNPDNTVVFTLPDDDRRVHLVFCGGCRANPSDAYANLDTGGPPTGDAPVPGGYKLFANMVLSGTVDVSSGGRGSVSNGVAEGSMGLSLVGDDENDSVAQCISAVNSWSLTPR